MLTGTEVVNEGPARLERTRWRFTLIDGDLVLTSYAHEIRPSRRHNYRADKTYDAYDRRARSGHIAAPEIPPLIAAQAIQQFVSGIKVRHLERGRS